jgi:hypothetical protein
VSKLYDNIINNIPIHFFIIIIQMLILNHNLLMLI